MKKFIFILFAFCFGLLSCDKDNNDYKDNNEIIEPVPEPEPEPEPEILISELQSFRFLAKDNTQALISDIECLLIGDSIIECHIPHIVENKIFIPSFKVINGKLMCNGKEVVSGVTELNCTQPIKLELAGSDKSTFYSLRVTCFTGLPVIYIDTENKEAITSKEKYVKGTFKIVEDIETRGAGDVFEATMKIKGRGNSTWKLPKKPYKMKFDDKVSLLGAPADKEWVLLANYIDKTSLRNETAFDMGRRSKLDYTNRTHFVEVIINGEYNGTYQLCEQLKIAKNRVNVGDDGFLLEVDAKADADDITFKIKHITQPINIKDPDVEVDDEAYKYVVQYLQKADSTLFCDNFKDQTDGYVKYIDVDSFVDWYLINEISKNNDARFYSSCYMNLSRNGKLKMGPLWDFDIAFGNVNYNGCDDPEGFWIKGVAWFKRFFEDPDFVKKVKERFAYFYGERENIYKQINANATYLKYAVIENNNKWKTFYTYVHPNSTIWGSYENEVQSMKIWLEKRFQWLNEQYSAM